MADLETRVDKIEGRVSTLEITIEKLSQKIDDYIAESRAARAEAKEEMKEMRANIAATNQKLDALSAKIDTRINQMNNLTIASMVGIGAMVVGVGAIAAAIIIALFR